MKCFNHPGVDAVGICTKCGKAVCIDCTSGNGPVICKSCADAPKTADKVKAAQSADKKFFSKPPDFPDSPFIPCAASLIIPGLGLYMVIPDRNKFMPFLQILLFLIVDMAFIITTVSGLFIILLESNFSTVDTIAYCCLPLICIPTIRIAALSTTYMAWTAINKGTYKGQLF